MVNVVPGTIVDERFEILDRLGEGGIGQVFSARQMGLNRTVAVKMLYSTLIADDNNTLQRFEREGKILSTLQHPNIPAFYHFGVWHNQYPYIAMELVSGRSLREVLDSSPMEWPDAARLITRIAEVLQSVHSAGFVHRDLKPQNIMITGDGTIKLVDFGLAGIIENASFGPLTKSNVVLGSIYYMSPEQCTGQKADHRADIYALGCILFECITRQTPFVGDSPMGLLHKHAVVPARRLSAATGMKFPPELEAVVRKCLDKSPGQRYGSAAELIDDLQSLLDQYANVEFRPRSAGRTDMAARMALALLITLSCALLLILSDHKASLPLTLQKQGESLWTELHRAEDSLGATPPNADAAMVKVDELLRNGGNSTLMCAGHTLKASILLQQKNFDLARLEARRAIRVRNTRESAHFRGVAFGVLARIEQVDGGNRLLRLSYMENCTRLLEEPSEESMFVYRLLVRLGLEHPERVLHALYEETGQWNRATKFWNGQMEKTSDKKTREWLIRALIGNREYLSAERELFSILSQSPNDVRWLGLWVLLLCKENRFGAAELVTKRAETCIHNSESILQRKYPALMSLNAPERKLSNPRLVDREFIDQLGVLLTAYRSLATVEMERCNVDAAYRLITRRAALARGYDPLPCDGTTELERLALQMQREDILAAVKGLRKIGVEDSVAKNFITDRH